MMKDNMLNTRQFYDTLAGDYNEMIRFSQRLETEIKVLQRWQKIYRFKSVLDAGCGSGLHSLAFSALGLSVTGVDLSENMIHKAQENAGKLVENRVSFIQSSFKEIPKRVNKTVDAVFCLGNSLAHCVTREELIAALKAFHRVCNEGGLIVVQLLNYNKILNEKERIVAINYNLNKEYIRFYDFIDPLLNFNILKIDRDEGTHALQTTTLFPYTLVDIVRELEFCGCRIEKKYGSLNFEEFDENKSANLIITIRR